MTCADSSNVFRNDGNCRRDSGRKHHEARNRGPHELRHEALSEVCRSRRGATSAPDCQEHRGEHAHGNQRAHSQYYESHTHTLLGAREPSGPPTAGRSAMGSPAHPRPSLGETAAARFTAGATAKIVGKQRARRTRPVAQSFPVLREVGGDGAGVDAHAASAKGRGAGRQRANEQPST